MGEEVVYHCPKCGRDHYVSIGPFFLSPGDPVMIREGFYGKRAKKMFERHPGKSAFFEHVVFRCNCGYARSKRVMTIFGDDKAPWDRWSERNVVWDNAKCRCPRCGRSMRIVGDYPSRIRCTCGAWTEGYQCWCLFD